jgi:HSP20 family protein
VHPALAASPEFQKERIAMLLHWNDLGIAEWDRAARELDVLRREMDRVFDDFGRTPAQRRTAQRGWPRIELADTGSALVLRAEVPGVTNDDLKVQVDQATLTLQGTRRVAQPEGYDGHRRERAPYEFTRSFTLPVKVDAEQAKATLKHGVLTLTLPKAAEVQPRQIKVSSS